MPPRQHQQPVAGRIKQEFALRCVSLGLLLLIAGVNYKIWAPGDSGWRGMRSLQLAVVATHGANQHLEVRNAGLAADNESLRNGMDGIEERARSSLGMIKQGETLYRVLDGESASSSVAD